MAQEGEILDTDITQNLADALDIGGVRRYPNKLNLDDVKVVADLLAAYDRRTQTPEPNEGMGTPMAFDISYPLETLLGATITVVGETSDVVQVGDPLESRDDICYRFDAFEVAVEYTTAGATTDAARNIHMQIVIGDDGDPGIAGIPIINLPAMDVPTGSAANTRYTWGMWQNSATRNSSGGPSFGASNWEGGFRCKATISANGEGGGGTHGKMRLEVRIAYADPSLAFAADTFLVVRGIARQTDGANSRVAFKL